MCQCKHSWLVVKIIAHAQLAYSTRAFQHRFQRHHHETKFIKMSFLLYSVKNDSLSVKLRSTQMTVETLGKVFNFVSATIFLVGDDGSVATPCEDGTFDTFEMNCDVVWTVCGSSSLTREGPGGSTSSSINRQQNKAGSGKWRPSVGSSIVAASSTATPAVGSRTSKHESKKPSGGGGPGQSWTKTVEICCYELSSSCIKKTFNLPLTLNENTATVTRIADITSAEAFEGDAVVLLDSENLRIPDSVGTRGIVISFEGSTGCMHAGSHQWLKKREDLMQKKTFGDGNGCGIFTLLYCMKPYNIKVPKCAIISILSQLCCISRPQCCISQPQANTAHLGK